MRQSSVLPHTRVEPFDCFVFIYFFELNSIILPLFIYSNHFYISVFVFFFNIHQRTVIGVCMINVALTLFILFDNVFVANLR